MGRVSIWWQFWLKTAWHVAPLPLGVSLYDALSGFTAFRLLIIIAQSLIVKKIKTFKQKNMFILFVKMPDFDGADTLMTI